TASSDTVQLYHSFWAFQELCAPCRPPNFGLNLAVRLSVITPAVRACAGTVGRLWTTGLRLFRPTQLTVYRNLIVIVIVIVILISKASVLNEWDVCSRPKSLSWDG